jgi:hypothetical protein
MLLVGLQNIKEKGGNCPLLIAFSGLTETMQPKVMDIKPQSYQSLR